MHKKTHKIYLQVNWSEFAIGMQKSCSASGNELLVNVTNSRSGTEKTSYSRTYKTDKNTTLTTEEMIYMNAFLHCNASAGFTDFFSGQ